MAVGGVRRRDRKDRGERGQQDAEVRHKGSSIPPAKWFTS
jgi:hypothetical protein